MRQRDLVSVVYKFFTIVSLVLGIILNTYKTKSLCAILSYYTLQSNILCLIAFCFFVVLELKNVEYKNSIYYQVKGAIIIAILLTMIVYHVALAPVGFEMDSLQKATDSRRLANLFVHTVSPMMVIGDYLIFDIKGNFKISYIFKWLIFPMSYAVYVYTYAFLGGEFFSIGGSRKFAYFFLDYEEIGILGVAKWVVLILAAIFVISYLIVMFDNRKNK